MTMTKLRMTMNNKVSKSENWSFLNQAIFPKVRNGSEGIVQILPPSKDEILPDEASFK